jgi:nitroreductase
MNPSNETLNTILKRKTIRKFKTYEIPRNIVNEIILAGQRAPSSCNHQTYTFILVESIEKRKEIMKLCKGQGFIKKAPVWIVICSDLFRLTRMLNYLGIDHCFKYGYGLSETLYSIVDASLVAENMVIAAESLELGSVFIGDILYHAEKVSRILRLPEMVMPLLLLCIGYPSENPPLRARWPTESITYTDQYTKITDEEIELFLRNNFIQQKKEHDNLSLEKVEKEFLDDLKEHTDKETHSEHDPKLAQFLRKTGFLPKY